jgi:hypothetical protein
MSNTRRLVAGFAALLCAAAVPAVAAAHHGQPAHHGHKGSQNSVSVRLTPVSGQTAKGRASLKQHSNALSIQLTVSGLTPGSFYGAFLNAGTCAAPGAVALTFPDVYADEHGVAQLVTSLPTASGANFIATGYNVNVHAGPSATTTPVITCGDINVRPPKSFAQAWIKGTPGHGHAVLEQKGSNVFAQLKLAGLTPGAHGVTIVTGTCAAPGADAVSLGDVTAGPNGFAFGKLSATSTSAVVGTGFSVAVHAGPSATPGAVVACGDLKTWTHGHM